MPTSAVQTALDVINAPVVGEFAAVGDLLRGELSSQEVFAGGLLAEVAALGGKRLRTSVLLLAGRACGTLTADHLRAAVAVELVHTATLLHDDVLDDALTRRGRATLNTAHHAAVPILLGDHLFARAFALVARLRDREVAVRLADAAGALCHGEMLQNHAAHRWDLGEDEYFEIIGRKTALLFAEAARLGAALCKAPAKQRDALFNFGREFGVAFQIMDDCMDLVGDEGIAGKTLGTDLRGGKATLPVIHLLRTLDGRERINVLDELRARRTDPATVPALLARHGSVDYARCVAREHLDAARAALEPLRESSDVEQLDLLCEFARSRDS